MTADTYFTSARDRDPDALKFEPWRGHRIERHPLGWFHVAEHAGWPGHWLYAEPEGARREAAACADGAHDDRGCAGRERAEEIERDPFARFER